VAGEDVLVVLGGQDTANTVFDDLWAFDIGSGAWVLAASDTRKRAEAAIACVSSCRRVVVFGGADAPDRSAVFNDMQWMELRCPL
jgi:hypothetical protein